MWGRSPGVNRAVRLPRPELAGQLASGGIAGKGADFVVRRFEHIDLQDISFQTLDGWRGVRFIVPGAALSGPSRGRDD